MVSSITWPDDHTERPVSCSTAAVRAEVPGKDWMIGMRKLGRSKVPEDSTSVASRQCAYSSW